MTWFEKVGLTDWQIGPFRKLANNPILTPQDAPWRIKNICNPTALTDGRRVTLIVRAQRHDSTSFLARAVSDDGVHFDVRSEPVLWPTKDHELPGGCEDPRVSKIGDTFFLTFTAFGPDKVARLCLATSHDLKKWNRHGPVFPDQGWTKAGFIVPEKILGKFWMFYGDRGIKLAVSDDAVHWKPFERQIVGREKDLADEVLEVGTVVQTKRGLLMMANEADERFVYRITQLLFDKNKPWKLLARAKTPCLEPTRPEEKRGEVENVVFAGGLVRFGGKWFLYYGAADRNINLAIA